MTRVLVAVIALLGAACSRPEAYAPPMQRRPLAGPDTSRLKHFIAMNDPAAEDHFLRDIGPLESGAFRWTNQFPTLRFVLPSRHNLKFKADFGIHGDTFAKTGPLTIAFVVNGRPLDRVRYDAPGGHSFEKAVPEDWLGPEDTIVKIELDKVYIAEADQVKLGITLVRAGFTE